MYSVQLIESKGLVIPYRYSLYFTDPIVSNPYFSNMCCEMKFVQSPHMYLNPCEEESSMVFSRSLVARPLPESSEPIANTYKHLSFGVYTSRFPKRSNIGSVSLILP
ncbi:hypothetical protein AR158_c768R [Paramecium bursaria Chlorella virus AR158]|uniref:hypothetical protein n=1 Tax=Paramecium bursaria Chlorella virus AR158 TaxID=380598 RepID=UPI00015AA8CD|nr:hypothetical protein AR158_c768R [Paramecium bursaria Chlorella virus AR158]ABU44313.1 hypothetical protein AR158_c768R [Paramecium bursaria Chlorella virus AR158]